MNKMLKTAVAAGVLAATVVMGGRANAVSYRFEKEMYAGVKITGEVEGELGEDQNTVENATLKWWKLLDDEGTTLVERSTSNMGDGEWVEKFTLDGRYVKMDLLEVRNGDKQHGFVHYVELPEIKTIEMTLSSSDTEKISIKTEYKEENGKTKVFIDDTVILGERSSEVNFQYLTEKEIGTLENDTSWCAAISENWEAKCGSEPEPVSIPGASALLGGVLAVAGVAAGAKRLLPK